VTQLVLARFPSRIVITGGLVVFWAGLALVAAGLSQASMALFLAGTIVSGVAVGAVFIGSLSTANRLAPPEIRGQVVSTYFVFAYVGLTIPVIGVGIASQYEGDFRAVLVCAIVLAALGAGSMAGIHRAGRQ
jgi:MFS family permease